VALLRAVNLGGHNRVPMADLPRGLQAAGLTGVRTYLQSGNAVFDDGPRDEAAAAALVRSVVASSCGVDTDVVVRSPAAMADVVARLPWPERTDDPTKVHVLLLDAVPDRVEVARVGPHELAHHDGREVYLFYGEGAGRSKLAVTAPGVVATARNWRTVLALAELSAADR
jgi:uncharacterized protein (DUF1697 family)